MRLSTRTEIRLRRSLFRFDLRYRALLGGSRAKIRKDIVAGFPHLPMGCEMRLDRESESIVLRNIRQALPTTTPHLADELAAIEDVPLREFLHQTELELEDVYRQGRSYTTLLHAAGLREDSPPEGEIVRAFSRLLHIDDPRRLDTWREWLRADRPPAADPTHRLQLMLFAGLGFVRRPVSELAEAFDELWKAADLRMELLEILEELGDRQRRPTSSLGDLPFHVHATYSRDEISAGLGQLRNGSLLRTQGGVYKDEDSRSDIFYVTLQKEESEFTPTTLYEDYAISPTRFHWESQSVTRVDSETGRRYQEHDSMDWRILLFVRQSKRDDRGVTMPFLFLGPVHYVRHESEKPMRVIWELELPMPHDFFREVKVAAG